MLRLTILSLSINHRRGCEMTGHALGRRDALRGLIGGGMTALLAACGSGQDATATGSGGTSASGAGSAAKQVTVAATTTQIQDFVTNVGASLVSVVGILKP